MEFLTHKNLIISQNIDHYEHNDLQDTNKYNIANTKKIGLEK